MTVYVDDMCAQLGAYVVCHMIADTEQELHAMADHIGIARRWYQGDHYDISWSDRALAVAAGAREITWRECGCMVECWRRGGMLGDPATAADRLRALCRQGAVRIR